MKWKEYIYKPGKSKSLSDLKSDCKPGFKIKDENAERVVENSEAMADLQDRLFAYNRYSLLIVLQAMDTAGKDGLVRHVMKGINPSGCRVKSFKLPSDEEINHDYLWRCSRALPERGQIGIFNRSYYEEVLVAKVHQDILENSKIPSQLRNDPDIWKKRYADINHFEKYLINNGTIILKFYLHISKKEQKKRLLARIEDPKKNWKFGEADLKERRFWNQYIQAYQDMLDYTSTKEAPWFVVPSDNKWYSRVVIGDIIVSSLKSLNLSYPVASEDMMKKIEEARLQLKKE